jgi:2-isopropylmalate synthase
MRVFTLDNTFGYNPGRADLPFSLADKLAIVHELDRLGIDYVEAGCPGASSSGAGNAHKFFAYARAGFPPAHCRLVAGLRLDVVKEPSEQDAEVHAAIEAGALAVAVCACSWHAAERFEDERRKIGQTVELLKKRGLEVMFRDEDFFRFYLANSLFALHTLESAKAAGADVLCLGDSSGAGGPQLVREICIEVRKRFEGILGIRAHDDSDLALANTLEAVEQGFTHVEGSVNVYGGRRGLANLCSIISALEHKLAHTTIGPDKLEEMNAVARKVAEAEAAMIGRRVQPAPADAARPGEAILQVLDPHLLHGLPERRRRALLDQVEALERADYDLRHAGGTLELLAREALRPEIRPFLAERYELASHSGLNGSGLSTATVTIRAGDHVRSETEDGDGAVNALERALRQCLFAMYPEIAAVRMTDYQVRPLEPAQGTLSRARVSCTWSDGTRQWTTAAVAKDIVEATWLALVDGFRLPLVLLGERGHAAPEPADSSWAV